MVISEFKNWGDVYQVEFYITVTNLPTSSWTNAFRFTSTTGNHGSDGDSIPALFIGNHGEFILRSSISNDFHYNKNIEFEKGRMYHITIGQQIDNEDGKYWYEIFVDGNSELKEENKNHKSYNNVKLYASDSFVDPFISDFGSICNVKIQPEIGKLL